MCVGGGVDIEAPDSLSPEISQGIGMSQSHRCLHPLKCDPTPTPTQTIVREGGHLRSEDLIILLLN